jgi:hypothetical protein
MQKKEIKTIRVDFETWKTLKEQAQEELQSIHRKIHNIVKAGKYYVYILHLDSDMVYIGQSGNIEKRLFQHFCNKNIHNIELFEFDTKQEARKFEITRIVESPNSINKSNIELNFDICEMSKFYGMILFNYLLKNNKIPSITKSFYFRQLDILNFCKQETNNTEMVFSYDIDFVQSIAKKENIDINNVIIRNYGDVGNFIHPLLAFDFIRERSRKAKIELFDFLYA